MEKEIAYCFLLVIQLVGWLFCEVLNSECVRLWEPIDHGDKCPGSSHRQYVPKALAWTQSNVTDTVICKA